MIHERLALRMILWGCESLHRDNKITTDINKNDLSYRILKDATRNVPE